MAYTFPAMVAWDPRVKQTVKNVPFQVYATTDTSYTTPLAITDPFGVPMAGNVLNSGTEGVFPQFQQDTQATVTIADATKTYAWTIIAIQPPTQDSAVAGFLNTPGSQSAAAIRAVSPSLWQPNTNYAAGQVATSPSGDTVTAKIAFTSSGTYNAANWNLSASYAKSSAIGAANGIPTLDSTGKVPAAQLPNLSTALRPVDTVPVTVYGDSYTTSTGASDAAHGFPTRFAKAVNATTTTLNGVSGTTLGQAVAKMVGDSNQSGGTWTVGTHGLVVVKSVINSIINITSANDAQEKIGFQNHLRTFLRIVRGSSWVPDTDASCVYTGTWTTPAVNKTNGGAAHKTSTNGDKVTITTTASEIAVMLLGFPGNVGSSFTVTVNGSAYSAEITNTGLTTTMINDANAWFPISVRVAGLTGTSTVVVTNTSAADFYFDGYIIKSATPTPVIVCKDATPTTAGLQINGADTNRTAANLATFNGYIDTICGSAEFSDGLVKVADPGPAYDNTTMESTTTRPHPNNIGHAVYSYAIQQAANNLSFSTGLNL